MKTQPAVVIGTLVTVIDAVLASAIPMSDTLRGILIAVVTLAGAFGIRSQVTPTAKPRGNDGRVLTPAP